MMDHWNHNDILSIFPAELLLKTAGTRRKKAITNAHDISLSLLHALASISRITKGRHQEVMSAYLTERQFRSDGLNYLMVADVLGARPLFEEGGEHYQAEEEDDLAEREDEERQPQRREENTVSGVDGQEVILSIEKDHQQTFEPPSRMGAKRKRAGAFGEEEDNEEMDHHGSTHSSKSSRSGDTYDRDESVRMSRLSLAAGGSPSVGQTPRSRVHGPPSPSHTLPNAFVRQGFIQEEALSPAHP